MVSCVSIVARVNLRALLLCMFGQRVSPRTRVQIQHHSSRHTGHVWSLSCRNGSLARTTVSRANGTPWRSVAVPMSSSCATAAAGSIIIRGTSCSRLYARRSTRATRGQGSPDSRKTKRLVRQARRSRATFRTTIGSTRSFSARGLVSRFGGDAPDGVADIVRDQKRPR